MSKGSIVRSPDGTRIWYDINRGKKDFLIFIHGLSGSSSAWKPAFDFFRKRGYSCVITDLRGHGLSSKPRKYSLGECAGDINLIMERENIRKAVIVGHCFGGMVSQKFYELFPGKAERLILIDTGYFLRKYRFIYWKAMTGMIVFSFLLPIYKTFRIESSQNQIDYSKYRGTGDIYLPRNLRDLSVTHMIPFIRFYWLALNFDSRAVLRKINVPTLIIHGSRDSFFPKRIAIDMNSLIRGSELKILDGLNHIPVINQPEIINELILGFVK